MRSDNSKFIPRVLLLISLSLTACGGGTTAPVVASAPAITSVGTDFYLALPDNLYSTYGTYNFTTNKLIVAAAAATTGTVTFNGMTTSFSVTGGGETVIALDPKVVLTANETVEAKGIHVTSAAPISVHVVSEHPLSADGYLALPTPGLGTKYYVMSLSSAPGSEYNGSGSEFAIVATQNATTVSITPSAAGATKQAGVMFTVSLNAGETYQLANPANSDMTGTLVTADKPIAVFSGHRCANLPSATGACDYLVEQLTDVSIWGKTFHTSLFSGRARYTVRVVASQNATTFTTVPGGLIGTLNAGQFADVIMTGPGEFVSNNPVMVAQFMHGYADDTAGKGDPSMVLVTPAEMGVTSATFGVHGLPRTASSNQFAYMNVVTETKALANLKLDTVAVDTTQFLPIGATYSVGTIPVVPGAHTLIGSAPYSAFVYDYGVPMIAVSYAYPVASQLSWPTVSSGCVDVENEDEDMHLTNGLDDFGKINHAHRHSHGAENDDSQECH